MAKLNTYHAEVTDTFGGEANYCWVRRYSIKAKSALGAIQKLSKAEGYGFRKDWGNADNDQARYNATGACVCAFLEYVDVDGWSNTAFDYNRAEI